MLESRVNWNNRISTIENTCLPYVVALNQEYQAHFEDEMLIYKSQFSNILVSDAAYFMDFQKLVLRAWNKDQVI